MNVIERAEGVVHHCDDVVLLENGASVYGVEDLLEVGLDEFNDHEYLLEAMQIDVLVLVQLFVDYLIRRKR